jgi:hypothetical protein
MIDVSLNQLSPLLDKYLAYQTKYEVGTRAFDYLTKDSEMEKLKKQYLKAKIMRERAGIENYFDTQDFEDELNDNGEDDAIKNFATSKIMKKAEKIPLFDVEPLGYNLSQKIFSDNLKPVVKEATAYGPKLSKFARILSRLR